MIANINDKPVPGAMCMNCKAELRSWVIETNHGKQAVYACENQECGKRPTFLTVEYFPPAETGAV